MARKPFQGVKRQLLLAFDIGTTFSGVSYSIMDPGDVPEIRTVTRFPEQVQSGGDCKIPTVIYYDRDGEVCKIGAEAVAEGIEGIAEDEGWTKAEWFKLHLRPRGQRSNLFGPSMPPLPPGKTVIQVFADYMRYLFDCTALYIAETHANGGLLWNSVKDDIAFVFTHPNGWEGAQQAQMRQAAVMAGLIPGSDEGHKRIHFVTEGESSLHYCINNGLSTEALQEGEGVVIVDAGGGTIDISAYQGVNETFKEIAVAQCHFQGSVFVTARARQHIQGHLRGSRFEDDVPYIAERFDKRTKHAFKSDTDIQFIQFSSIRDTEPDLDIRHGQLKLKGSVVSSFFQPSIQCIIKAVERQMASSHHPISTVLLVGGFAASDWLYKKVKEALESKNVVVFRPDSHTNKAVSDGAASFYLDQFVKYRVSKYHYGIEVYTPYAPENPEHYRRRDKVTRHSVTQTLILDNQFFVLLAKDTQVSEAKEFRSGFSWHFSNPNSLRTFSRTVHCYRGSLRCPDWTDEDSGSFLVACTVAADISGVTIAQTFSPVTQQYCQYAQFDMILIFGGTELKAQIAWKVNGVERRSRARIIYEEVAGMTNALPGAGV
ncbi:hypothetical protein CC1G_04586 [Coprinopsis cinerea okayama7|uniref:Heat shock 70 kDa protein 12A n=1 Tax=Coprinopsis cinerea (strain Okayama-7 / 130 / ATCC MYA-4618 / FGSC 9003) TaxID=240176 RepID=A8N508_COPC7|nr:hypothetical protein CC1G_04586 [Coprinopsis cinerea okayama7\|eukprot:XP_001829897.2 hypothetical protein CC1G_04586 [Coprinopsis cinerea okayama7\